MPRTAGIVEAISPNSAVNADRSRDITGASLHIDAAAFQPREHCLRFIGACAAPSEQNEVACAVIGEPFRGSQSEAREAAGDDIGGIGGEFQTPRLRRSRHIEVRNAIAVGDDDLADVARLLHVPERIDDIGRFESLVRQRPQHAIVEQRQYLGKQPASQLRPLGHQLVGVDAEIADVIAERSQADARIFVEVALTQFQEAAERLQHAEVAVDCLAGERIEHDVDARAAGGRQNFVGEREIARIKNAIDAEQAQEIALLIRARGRVDVGAAPFGHLDRRDADAPGRAVNQHLFALLQLREVMQRVISREESRGYGRGRLE